MMIILAQFIHNQIANKLYSKDAYLQCERCDNMIFTVNNYYNAFYDTI